MDYETYEGMRVVEVTVDADFDDKMDDVYSQFNRIYSNNFDTRDSEFVNGIAAFPKGDSRVTISLGIVDWCEMCGDPRFDSINTFRQLPVGDTTTVESFFEGRWEEDVIFS